MILALPAAIVTLAPQNDAPVGLVDRGIRTGLAGVGVPAGAKVTRTVGPDFDVIDVSWGGHAAFGVYSGGYPQVTPDAGRPLFEGAGLTVRPSHRGGKFLGHLISNRDYQKNHFFGAAFKNNADDAMFFRRALFGKAAAAKCNSPTGASQ